MIGQTRFLGLYGSTATVRKGKSIQPHGFLSEHHSIFSIATLNLSVYDGKITSFMWLIKSLYRNLILLKHFQQIYIQYPNVTFKRHR